MKCQVILEFDEKELGEKWMNEDNMKLCLYTDVHTKKDLLKIIKFEDISPVTIRDNTFHHVPPGEIARANDKIKIT